VLNVKDDAGNTAASDAANLDLDTTITKPTLTIANANLVTNAAEKTAVAFTTSGIDADVANADATVTFTDHLGGQKTVLASAGPADLSSLADGQITAVLNVKDDAGNTAASTAASLTLDTTPPAAPSITTVTDNVPGYVGALSNNAVTNDADLAVSVKLATLGSKAVAGDVIQLFNGTTALGGAHVLTGDEITAGAVTLQTGALANGTTYALTAKVTDQAGNVGVASGAFNVTIDTTAPAPVVTNITYDAVTKLTTIKGVSEAGSSVDVSDNGTVIGTTTATGGVWSVTVNAPSNALHQYTESSTDIAGNTGTSTGVAIYKNSANNSLSGGTGDDVLIGRPNDTLVGGAGSDHFVFNPGFGKETINDFTHGSDVVVFDKTLFANFQDLAAHAQVGPTNTVITYDSGDVVTIKGLTSLYSADFVFI
jgi:hypothetical protein